jgi:L-ribulose-5-phosphate 4-epimerase
MILLGSHGPYTWGKNAATAVYNASALEQIAHMAFLTPFAQRIKTALITKHYTRSWGERAS